MLDRKCAERHREWIGQRVGDDDRLSPMRRRSANGGTRTNGKLVHRFDENRGQARSRRDTKYRAGFIGSHDRAEHAGRVPLDPTRERLERFVHRPAARDERKDFLLPVHVVHGHANMLSLAA